MAYLILFTFCISVGSAAAAPSGDGPARQAFLNRYCSACHNQKTRTAGLALDEGDPARPAARADIWEKVVHKMRTGDMPPAGLPRPDATAAAGFTSGLLRELDEAAAKSPYTGRPVIRRLNRFEYSNAIRDLLHIELPVAGKLPPDGMAGGFDNIGDALSMSPLLLEQYLKVARRVAEYAVGVSDPSPVTENFPAPEGQSGWLGAGMPFGTRGGIRVQFYFPHDGEYKLRAFLGKEALPPTEGVRFFQASVQVKAGTHVVIATFPDEYAAREGPVPNVTGLGGAALGGPLDTRGSAFHPTIEFRVDSRRVRVFDVGGLSVGEAAFAGQPGPPTMDRLEISGPYNASGVSETASRKRIFVCRPTAAGEEAACAAKVLSTVARRAFRREVGGAELKPYLAQYAAARKTRGFDASIAAALRDILLAPDFLFRLEFDPAGAAPGSVHAVSETELASRLSFFLWSTIPDDELLDAARDGKLRAGLEWQLRRMLADPRASALADNFAEQWLGLRGLAEVKPDKTAYPDYDGSLAANFEEETRLFVRSVFRENRSVVDLVNADYSYLNERLANTYGIAGVIGPGFRRVSLASHPERGGLLGQGSVLLLTSHTTKTSPILRGKWILENLLNSPPPPPPPGVPPLDENAADAKKLTLRQQIERHRKDPMCGACHARMDPLGFALENFDVIGRWRTRDGEGKIDASAKLPNGAAFDGPRGLKEYLAGHKEQFAGAAVSRLMTYALGRQLDTRDQPTVRRILQGCEAGGYRFGDLVAAIVKSTPFQMRQAQGTKEAP